MLKYILFKLGLYKNRYKYQQEYYGKRCIDCEFYNQSTDQCNNSKIELFREKIWTPAMFGCICNRDIINK